MAHLTRQQSEERGLVAQIAVTAKRRAHAAVDAAKSVTQTIQQRVSGSSNAATLPGSVRGMGGKGNKVAPVNPYARAQPSSFLAQLGASQRQLQEAQAELAEQAKVLAQEEQSAHPGGAKCHGHGLFRRDEHDVLALDLAAGARLGPAQRLRLSRRGDAQLHARVRRGLAAAHLPPERWLVRGQG